MGRTEATGHYARCGAVALVTAVAGCSSIPTFRLGQEPALTGDGFCDAGQAGDGGDLACVPFGPPTLVSELESSGDYDEKPTLSLDMLEMYFLSNRDGGYGLGDVWRTTRSTASSSWSTPTLVAELSTPSHEKSPALASDSMTLWFSSDRDGGLGGLDIYVSTRMSDDAGGVLWSAPSPVTSLNSTGDEIPRPPGAADLLMPIARRSAGNSSYEILGASRTSTAATAVWTSPLAISSVDTAGLNTDGFLTADGLTLYFSSDRLNGTQDLFVTQRPTLDAPFAPPLALDSLNTSNHDERDPWVSPDGHEIYFTSDRTDGNLHIFHATR